jgi:hypothetical protein
MKVHYEGKSSRWDEWLDLGKKKDVLRLKPWDPSAEVGRKAWGLDFGEHLKLEFTEMYFNLVRKAEGEMRKEVWNGGREEEEGGRRGKSRGDRGREKRRKPRELEVEVEMEMEKERVMELERERTWREKAMEREEGEEAEDRVESDTQESRDESLDPGESESF